MTTAEKILIVGGMLNLLWGLLTGIPLARVRMTKPVAPKYLNLTHVGGLMWAPILLSLVWAVRLSDLPASLECAAAAALVVASALLDVKDLANWLGGVGDEFVEKPPGFVLGGLSAVLSLFGTIVLTVGVLRGLSGS